MWYGNFGKQILPSSQGSLIFLCVLCIVYLVTFQTVLKDILCYICSLKSLLLKLVSAHVWIKSYLNSQNKKRMKKPLLVFADWLCDGPSLKTWPGHLQPHLGIHFLLMLILKIRERLKHRALSCLSWECILLWACAWLSRFFIFILFPLHFWWSCHRRSKPYFTSLLQKEAYHLSSFYLQSKPERVLEYSLNSENLAGPSIAVVSANLLLHVTMNMTSENWKLGHRRMRYR